jgi:hypothetical protein
VDHGWKDSLENIYLVDENGVQEGIGAPTPAFSGRK